MKRVLAPSILSGNFAVLGEEIRAIEKAGAEYLHFDVMDGIFVPNISFGIPVLKSLRPITGLFMDVHLMITDPKRFVADFAAAGADLITFHVEACRDKEDIAETIAAIRGEGKKVGLSVNPETEAGQILPWLEKIDLALVMGVHPGFGGQSLIEETLDKCRIVREIIDSKGLTCDLEFDGGVKIDNVNSVLDAGVNVVVAGSAVFGGDTFGHAKAFMERLA